MTVSCLKNEVGRKLNGIGKHFSAFHRCFAIPLCYITLCYSDQKQKQKKTNKKTQKNKTKTTTTITKQTNKNKKQTQQLPPTTKKPTSYI